MNFLKDPNVRRKYLFYPKQTLAATCSRYRMKGLTESKSERTLINGIVKYENDKQLPNHLPPVETKEEVQERSISHFLKNSFQKRFTGAKRDNCAIGHRNEPLLSERFIMDVDEGKLLDVCNVKQVVGAYTVGLVAKNGKEYVKDSIDLVLLVEVVHENSEVVSEVWGCEINSRVLMNECVKEIELQRKIHGDNALNDCVYTHTHCNFLSDQIRKLSERCQILHHAHVFDLEKIVFLVGDKNANILHGNIVVFSNEVRKAYGEVFDDMYKMSLAWAYDPCLEDYRDGNVTEIASRIPEIGGKNEFQSVFHLWKHLSTQQALPLTPLKRLIPAIHASWNALKSGSDMTTKIIEAHRVMHPHTNCNSRTSSRTFTNSFAAIHRYKHILGCHSPGIYKSLRHLKNAASQRQPFSQTLLKLYFVFRLWAQECQSSLHHEYNSPMIRVTRNKWMETYLSNTK